MDNLNTLLFVINNPINFDLYYIIILYLITALFIYVGVKQQYPISTWLSATTLIMVLLTFGIKIFGYPVKFWPEIITGQHIEATQIKFAPGGLLLAALGFLILRFYLKIKPSILDHFIILLPIIGVVQRVNCLLTGCCYGKPTEMSWAIHYPSSSAIFNHQVESGLILPSAGISSGVHPTQIYYIAGYLIIFALLVWIKRHTKALGSLTLYGLLFFCILRFTIDFYRDNPREIWYYSTWMHIAIQQWISLFLIVVIAFALWYRETHYKKAKSIHTAIDENITRNIILVILSATLVWNTAQIFVFHELLILRLLFFAAFVANGISLYQKNVLPQYRFTLVTLICFALLLMGQQLPEQKTDSLATSNPAGWVSIGASSGAGKYEIVTKDCNGNETSSTKKVYTISNLSVAYRYKQTKTQLLDAGLNFYNVSYYTSPTAPWDRGFFFANPYIKYDFSWVGLGVGLHSYLEKVKDPFEPSFYLRLGKKEKRFVDFSYMNDFSFSGPLGKYQFGAGAGFGKYNDNQVRAGISAIENIPIFFLSGSFVIQKRFSLRTDIGFGDSKFLHGSVGLQVHLGKNRWETGK
jgi:hypothetical protein